MQNNTIDQAKQQGNKNREGVDEIWKRSICCTLLADTESNMWTSFSIFKKIFSGKIIVYVTSIMVNS